MKGYYKCECGKEFDKPNKFNAHKSHCRTHLGEEKYYLYRSINKSKLLLAAKKVSKEARLKRCEELSKWISEQHTCERCGKVMVEKFASGRFCSRGCANVHYRIPEEERLKRQQRKEKKQELSNSIPQVERSKYEKGYPNRSRITYAEKFWQVVLLNNSIKFESQFKVLKHDHTPGCFKMDFLLSEYNVDLEIDGELHEFTKEKDERRDKLIKSRGFIVYRIKWVNPTTLENKTIVKNQIDSLLEFLHNSGGINETLD